MTVRFRRLSVVVLLSALVLIMASQSIVGQMMPPWAEADLAAPNYSGCGGNIAPAINTALEQEVVVLVNDIRTSNGLPALKATTELIDAARYYSTDMGQDNYFPDDHATYDGAGGTSFQCDMGARVKSFYDWSFVAENIMSGCTTAQCAVDWWMGSSGHRTNILRDTICETGVGYYDLMGSGSPYITQDFGWRPDVYPVVINGDKTTTNSETVSVSICVPNISWAEKWNEMCVSNDGAPCTNWIPLLTPFTWHLNGGNGTKTVTVQLRDGTKTTTSSDTIYLDESAPPPGKPMDVHLPMVLKNYGVAPSPGWKTIMTEDFEGTFPGAWTVLDRGPGTGEYYWAKRSCRPYAGSYSGWAVGGGFDGAALNCGSNYPDKVESWMRYGPFSLADATAAELSFQQWKLTEGDYYDFIYRGAAINDYDFYGYRSTGNSHGWQDKTLDLTDVPTLGDLTGQPQVWIVLVFYSDASTNRSEGAYVDNIVLRKYVSATGQSPPLVPGSGANDLNQGGDTVFEVQLQTTR